MSTLKKHMLLEKEYLQIYNNENLFVGTEVGCKGGRGYCEVNVDVESAFTLLFYAKLKILHEEDFCERAGIRTLNQWLKRPLLYH